MCVCVCVCVCACARARVRVLCVFGIACSRHLPRAAPAPCVRVCVCFCLSVCLSVVALHVGDLPRAAPALQTSRCECSLLGMLRWPPGVSNVSVLVHVLLYVNAVYWACFNGLLYCLHCYLHRKLPKFLFILQFIYCMLGWPPKGSLRGQFPSACAKVSRHDRAHVSNIAFFKISETWST